MNTLSPTQRLGASAFLFISLLPTLLALGACSSASDAAALAETSSDVAVPDSTESCASDAECSAHATPAADASAEAEDAAVPTACAPGGTMCEGTGPFGQQPQRCTALGRWENVGAACAADEYCVADTCTTTKVATPNVVVPGVDDRGEIASGNEGIATERTP